MLFFPPIFFLSFMFRKLPQQIYYPLLLLKLGFTIASQRMREKWDLIIFDLLLTLLLLDRHWENSPFESTCKKKDIHTFIKKIVIHTFTKKKFSLTGDSGFFHSWRCFERGQLFSMHIKPAL